MAITASSTSSYEKEKERKEGRGREAGSRRYSEEKLEESKKNPLGSPEPEAESYIVSTRLHLLLRVIRSSELSLAVFCCGLNH